jgi:hypothetical protein
VEPWSGEPFIGQRNPRDGLVSIIAATTGEEEFTDQNANGLYDFGEPYIDLGEPFVDVNDNGVHEPDEQFLDANNNFSYDGPNGVWDSDTLIWTEARMLWTGHVATGECGAMWNFSGFCPRSAYIIKGESAEFEWEVKDINLNPINESGRLNVKLTGKGSLGGATPNMPYNLPDVLGYWENPDYWAGQGGGFWGSVLVYGAPITDVTQPQEGKLTLEVEYRDTPGAGDNNAIDLEAEITFQ